VATSEPFGEAGEVPAPRGDAVEADERRRICVSVRADMERWRRGAGRGHGQSPVAAAPACPGCL